MTLRSLSETNDHLDFKEIHINKYMNNKLGSRTVNSGSCQSSLGKQTNLDALVLFSGVSKGQVLDSENQGLKISLNSQPKWKLHTPLSTHSHFPWSTCIDCKKNAFRKYQRQSLVGCNICSSSLILLASWTPGSVILYESPVFLSHKKLFQEQDNCLLQGYKIQIGKRRVRTSPLSSHIQQALTKSSRLKNLQE